MRKKIIPFGDFRYSISNTGLVINTRTGRILKPNDVGDGYLQVKLCHSGEIRGFLIHQLVGRAFKNNPKGLSQLNHKDFNTSNNKSSNLEWVTPSQNVTHSYKRNRRCGSYPGRLHRKLDDIQVKTIKTLKGELPILQIANYFKVNRSTIRGIFNGRTGRHVA